MKVKDIPFHRLAVQQISDTRFTSVKALAGYMGAIQSQDFMMAKRAIGLRTKGADEQMVDSAIIKGDIIRTHVLRPTWHFVSSDDLLWMLELTGSRIKTGMTGRHRRLELSPAILKKCKKIMSEALAGRNHLTRNELIKRLNDAKIKTDLNRASHIFAEAELSGLICSGIPQGKKQTYALISERVKGSGKITREEALARLARIYFNSRGPATIKDFSWWSGLHLTDSRNGLELVKEELSSFTSGKNTFWFSDAIGKVEPDDSLYLLPAFDEYLIGYTDRAAVLSEPNAKKYVTLNGMFIPIIVYRGAVAGTWKRTIKGDFVEVELKFFSKVTQKGRKLAEAEAERLAKFLGLKNEKCIIKNE